MTTATRTPITAKPETSAQPESRKVKVRILDKEVQLGCAAGEEDALAQAAQYVDDSMRKFRYRSNTSTPEKIAIVTAINIANDLLKMRARSHAFSYAESDLHTRLRKMQLMVETALEGDEVPAPAATTDETVEATQSPASAPASSGDAQAGDETSTASDSDKPAEAVAQTPATTPADGADNKNT